MTCGGHTESHTRQQSVSLLSHELHIFLRTLSYDNSNMLLWHFFVKQNLTLINCVCIPGNAHVKHLFTPVIVNERQSKAMQTDKNIQLDGLFTTSLYTA